MENYFSAGYNIDYVEIYTPMAKALAYWHVHALGFTITAFADNENIVSYVLESGEIRLVLTASYPVNKSVTNEVSNFIVQQYCGVKRFALQTTSVKEQFEQSILNGAVPVQFPVLKEDGMGTVEEAAIKFYDHSEIVFIDRSTYQGVFKPGFTARNVKADEQPPALSFIDHIAGEVRINEINYWSKYLSAAIGTSLVQSIQRSEENKTGMILNINQSPDKKLTLVMAEPDTYTQRSKIQQNIDRFGPGIHHVAFGSTDIVSAIKDFTDRNVEFVSFPASYYELLRNNEDFKDIDIDLLERHGILIDKEDDTYLLQKFIKPISDRPFFLYELVQRVNGYNGFALKNINVLKKAEEIEVMKAVN